MIKNILSNIPGVAIYSIISLIIFLILFVVMLIYVFRQKRALMEKMAALPLEDNSQNQRSSQ